MRVDRLPRRERVKNTGDGLIVAFGSASAAVEPAVSMHQLLELSRERGYGLYEEPAAALLQAQSAAQA